MMVCIVLIGIYFLLPEAVQSRIEPYAPVFCLETIAVMCFGASWLAKAEAISLIRDS